MNLAMPIMIAVKHPQIAQKGSKIDNFSNGFGGGNGRNIICGIQLIVFATNSSAL